MKIKEKLITQCCIKTCNKFEWPKNNWLSKKIYNSKIQKYLLRKIFNLFTEWKEESPDPQSTNISYTYCPVCFKKAMREIKNL